LRAYNSSINNLCKDIKLKTIFLTLVLLILSACTQGRLQYMTKEGNLRTACETEYTWQPSVDKYAVEYILSYCAKKATEKGHDVLDKSLLTLDTSIPKPPEGKDWSHALAKELHQLGTISDKEYGYIIAYIDLGLIQQK